MHSVATTAATATAIMEAHKSASILYILQFMYIYLSFKCYEVMSSRSIKK